MNRRVILWICSIVVIAVAGVGCPSTAVDEVDDPAEEEIMESDWEPMRTVEGEELDDEQLEALLARLPQLEEREEDEVGFKRRPDSPPPPRTGEEIDGQWPPDLSDPAAQKADDGPLIAQAFRPEGEVDPPFQVAISFDRPVVDVGAVGTQEIPDELQLEPRPDGRWRWLGTQTIIYEPDKRWPMATEFEVSLSEGLEAVDGSELDEKLRFEFTTPGPEVQTIRPRQRRRGPDQAVDAPVAVVFNQPIKPESADAISVHEGDDEIPMQTLADEAFDEAVEGFHIADAAEADRVIALKPLQDYSPEATVEVRVDGPIASQEGPVVGMADASSSFRVRGPMELADAGCGWRLRSECRPDSTVQLKFTNRIDPDLDDEDQAVEVEPEVENLEVSARGDSLRISGYFHPRTAHTFTVARDLIDEFGQTLEGSRTKEVQIHSRPPFFAGPDRNMVVRPPQTSPVLPVMVGQLEEFKTRVYRVEPHDWDRFTDYRPRRNASFAAGELVDQSTVRIPPDERNQPTEHPVDISAALDGDRGHAVVIIDEPDPWHTTRRRWEPRWAYWVQRTDLGVDVSNDGRQMVVDVRSLEDGKPVEGAEITKAPRQKLTDRKGEAAFTTRSDSSQPLVVRHDADSLVVPPRRRWNHRDVEDSGLWYIVDDRQTYKPGETVHIRGWMRTRENTPRSSPYNLAGLDSYPTVEYDVQGPRRNDVTRGEVQLDRFGGFEFEFEVPEETNLGTARISLSTSTAGEQYSHRHSVEFQEFRRPEYEVQLQTAAGPHLVGDELSWDAEASYYAGGGVSGADTEWNFDEDSASWDPPGWRGWNFGSFTPWWWWRSRDSDGEGGVLPDDYEETIEGHTDARGEDSVSFGFHKPERGFPRRVEGTVSVQDVDRQSWEATDSVVVHPASVYVGLRSDSRFLRRGESYELETIAVDLDGDPVEGRDIDVEIQQRSGDETTVATCSVTSKDRPNSCEFDELQPDRYRVVATVEDEAGRVAESEMTFWMSGRGGEGADTAEEDELMIVPDADDYAPGDTAELMVQAPYYPLDAVVELRRDGRYDRQRVTLTEDEPTFEVDIQEDMIPNVHIEVRAVGDGDAWDPEHFAAGSIELQIDPGVHDLEIDVQPESDEIAPGDELHTAARVTDANGNPVEDTQVLVWAVDESVLALSNYQLADPLSAFYPTRSEHVSDLRTFSWSLMDDSEEWEEDESAEEQPQERPVEMGRGAGVVEREAAHDDAMGMAMAEAAPAAPDHDDADPIEVREVFDALAFFRSDLTTDDEGRVELSETMPDSLTRYRVMAVAVAGDDTSFGSGETDVTARKPLMVAPSAPRFANVGDEFDVPLVVHNRTDEDKTVDVALESTAGLSFAETPGRRVQVPADDRVEIRFAAKALSAGDTRIQAAVAGANHTDAELIELPILTPATTEAFATYGTIDADDEDAVLEAVQVPEDAYPQYGGLEVSTSSTQLQALTDAFIYLINYPFALGPHIASQILSSLALYDVLEAFEADDMPDEEELDEYLDHWVDELQRLQRGDGGFGFWPHARRSSPYTSVHVTHALWKAHDEDIDVSSGVLRNAQQYLRRIDQHVQRLPFRSERAKASIEAYAIDVLGRMGDDVSGDVESLVRRYGIEELPIEALGRVLPHSGDRHHGRMLQRIQNQAHETAATAEFQETFEADAHRLLHTSRRTDGVVLDGLIDVDPDHPLIEKVVRGLLAHRERGRWGNTQENAFILMALRSYFDEYEDVDPDFVAGVWLGEDHIGEHEFAGRTTERHHVDVPMQHLMDGDDRWPVIFERDGVGRMYYRLGVDYAPKSRELPPADYGFTVERNYEPIDDEDDVRHTDDGWDIRAGARVRVELSMTIPARRYHVALVDWLPAGFEPLNPALEVTDVDDVDLDATTVGWFGRPWYRHENMRDERVEAFASSISEGTYTYSYVARATTPGLYTAMPAKAEEMYHPETFGRSATETVTVVDR